MPIATLNPTTGRTEKRFDEFSDAEIDDRVGRAASAFSSYRSTSFSQRARWLEAAAGTLESEAGAIARVVTTEMGKTLRAAQAEVRKCAGACRFYASNAEALLADEQADAPAVGARRALARYQPLGPVLAVMPWNFPLWQVVRFAAPSLMAGNVGLLKHASNVPQTALVLEDVFRRAGFPDGVFQTLLVGTGKVEQILRDERVRAATLTGSTPAGRAVGAIAGAEIKPSVLELGGSDAFVVMPSADLGRAVEVGVTSRCQNNGQSCIAAKRFIVHESVADEFESRFVERMQDQRVGDPLSEGTEIGPLATEQGRQDVEEVVSDAVAKGASVRCGGSSPEGRGWFYPPTVLTGVTPQMRVYSEEVFAPVAPVFRVADIDEAIELSNMTDFGLGSNAWTEDREEQDRFVRELEAGAVFVNGMTTSYPQLPFGGVKQSGYGRELAASGIRSFCNLKTVWIGGAGDIP